LLDGLPCDRTESIRMPPLAAGARHWLRYLEIHVQFAACMAAAATGKDFAELVEKKVRQLRHCYCFEAFLGIIS